MERVARHVRVYGLVQGVFFRAWTCEQAREIGVAGWVRNCADGSVAAHAEGEQAAVEQLIERMRQGPAAAHVDNLDVREAATENLGHFEVRH
jgi:acylphosphatase